MSVNRKLIYKAAEIIKRGGLVGFPTETVYGIAADPWNKRAISRLNKIKNRPKGKPYTLHIAYKKDINTFVEKLSPLYKKIIKRYWPGPLTIIIKDKNGEKMGFRMPENKIALSLIRKVGKPVVAPSANLSGEKSPICAKEVCKGLDMILDGGCTKYQKDSTILDLTANPPKILRQGAIKIDLNNI